MCGARSIAGSNRIAAKSGILASGQELTCEQVPDAERKLRRHLSANLVLDYISRCCYLSFSLAHEGAFLETILRRSEAWRPAAVACNRRPGRHGTPPAGHYDPDARSSL